MVSGSIQYHDIAKRITTLQQRLQALHTLQMCHCWMWSECRALAGALVPTEEGAGASPRRRARSRPASRASRTACMRSRGRVSESLDSGKTHVYYS